MLGLLLLGFVGTALAGSMIVGEFDSSSEDDENGSPEEEIAPDIPDKGSTDVPGSTGDDGEDPVEPKAEEELGGDLVYDGSDVLFGSDFDDVLNDAGQDVNNAPDAVYLGDGDDSVSLTEGTAFSVIEGGAGSDTLSDTTGFNTLNGGTGDDTLYGIDTVDMKGGAGDDDITFDGHTEYLDKTSVIDGGDGDDVIHIHSTVGEDWALGGAIVTGGEGADTFDVTVEVEDSQGTNSDDVVESSLARIDDFDPEEDAILLTLERDPDLAERDYEMVFEQTEQEGEYVTHITLIFAQTDTAQAAETTLTVHSDTPFTENDIHFEVA